MRHPNSNCMLLIYEIVVNKEYKNTELKNKPKKHKIPNKSTFKQTIK